jgi:hypothetical protein
MAYFCENPRVAKDKMNARRNIFHIYGFTV